jgi:hypothetical protein
MNISIAFQVLHGIDPTTGIFVEAASQAIATQYEGGLMLFRMGDIR